MEFSHLQELRESLSENEVAILTVETTNRLALTREYVKELGVSLPVLMDDKRVSRDTYEIQGTPTTLVIDRTGRIVFRHLGFREGMEEAIRSEVEALLVLGASGIPGV